MRIVLVVLALLLSQGVRAQSVSVVKMQIEKYSKKIEKFIETNHVDYDSSFAANKELLDYLTHVCRDNDELLKEKFPQKDDGALRVVTSKDNRLRIYWWLLAGGGTQHCYNSLMQYKYNGEVYVKVLSDESKFDSNDHRECGGLYSSIRSVKCKDGSTIYLLESTAIAWSSYGADILNAVRLGNDSVQPFMFFKTSQSTLSQISYEWDYSSAVNVGKERNVSFKFSPDKSILYVPLIKANNEITDKYLIYKFDGMQYVYSGVGK